MSKISELKEKLSGISEIFIRTKENFRFCYHLHISDNSDERDYLKIDRHIYFIRHSLWRMTVIELCKIFSRSPSDNYDLEKIIKALKPDGHFRSIRFDNDLLARWEDEIQSNKELIDKLNGLRNKIYAHSDPDRELYKNIDVYFNDIRNLLLLGETILKGIASKINMPTLIFDSPYFESQEFEIVKVLTQHHKDQISAIQKYLP